MPTLGLTPTLTFGGNTSTEKLIGSIAEVQIKKVLQNELSNQFLFRYTAAAKSINELPGLATAIYRQTKRNVWGTKYDLNTGATKQRGNGQWTPIQINKALNIKFMIEDYDIEKFLKSSPDIQAQMISDWITTLTTNLMQNLELIFRRGIIDYAIARSEIDSSHIMKVDPNAISKTEDSAKQFFMDFGLKITDKIRTIDETMIGTNMSDWITILDMSFIRKLTKAFTSFIDNTGAETLVSGTLYKNSVFGMPVSEDFWLDRKYDKTTETKMNTDITFDLTGIIGIAIHNDAFASPISFKYLKQVLDPETGNLQWIGKCMLGLPAALRPLIMILTTKDFVVADKIKLGLSGNDPGTDPFNLESNTYQVAVFDKLHEKIVGSGNNETKQLSEAQNKIQELQEAIDAYKKQATQTN